MYAERGTADRASVATKRRTMIAVRQSARDRKRNVESRGEKKGEGRRARRNGRSNE